MANDEEKPIRIVDRRMFTPEGDLRPDFEPEEPPEPQKPAAPPPRPAAAPRPPAQPSPPQGAAPPSPEPGPEEDVADREPAEPRTDFASLIRSLATTAYSSLGLLPDAAGTRRKDLAVARQMIEWLAVLEQKTRGNVSFEESDFLARILYELRLAYVEMTRPPK